MTHIKETLSNEIVDAKQSGVLRFADGCLKPTRSLFSGRSFKVEDDKLTEIGREKVTEAGKSSGRQGRSLLGRVGGGFSTLGDVLLFLPGLAIGGLIKGIYLSMPKGKSLNAHYTNLQTEDKVKKALKDGYNALGSCLREGQRKLKQEGKAEDPTVKTYAAVAFEKCIAFPPNDDRYTQGQYLKAIIEEWWPNCKEELSFIDTVLENLPKLDAELHEAVLSKLDEQIKTLNQSNSAILDPDWIGGVIEKLQDCTEVSKENKKQLIATLNKILEPKETVKTED